jgi:diguanylate cyclase (GGDEF)-like protein/PAS domain S-box-containing protein
MPNPFDSRRLAEAQARLRVLEDEQRVAEAIFRTTQPVMVTDARAHILRVNQAFCDIMGYRPEEMLGNTPKMFRSNHHDAAFYATMVETIQRTGQWSGEVWDRRKSGDVFPKWMTITAVPDASGTVTHMIACYTDLAERQRAREEIERLAFHDVITGLANRALLHERLSEATRQAGSSGEYAALLLLDWDDFRSLNDSLGYPQGDALLRLAGQRICACVRASDTVARPGGDEFAIVLHPTSDRRDQAAAQTEAMGTRILQALAEPCHIGGTDYQGSASMGVVLFADEQLDANALLKQAELAMYEAKHNSRGSLHFFDSQLEQAVSERMRIERELRAGIAAGQLRLHYQPQVTMQEGRHLAVVGAEALVRWQHPRQGLIAPGRFIALAEETGLIAALGRWVLQTACKQLAVWKGRPAFADLVLAVNVSAAQFLEPGFTQQVLELLASTGAPPGRLKLELTESLLVQNAEAVIATMSALQAHGIQFSLDDFGTGYSSLAYLKRLPLQQLKIDQGFVRDLETDGNDATIARSIAALARGLGLTVIAEGVETAGQRDLLAAMGCTTYQGYYYSRPLALQDFEAWCLRQAGVAA